MPAPASAAAALADPLATAREVAGFLLVLAGGVAVFELLVMRAVETARAVVWRRERPYRYGARAFLRRLVVWGLVCWTGIALLERGAGWRWLLGAWGVVLAVAVGRRARTD